MTSSLRCLGRSEGAHHLHRGVVLGGGAQGETEGEHRGGGQAQCGHEEEVLLVVPTLGSHREGVEEGGDEEEEEEEDDGEEDEPLEPPPQDEAKSLIGERRTTRKEVAELTPRSEEEEEEGRCRREEEEEFPGPLLKAEVSVAVTNGDGINSNVLALRRQQQQQQQQRQAVARQTAGGDWNQQSPELDIVHACVEEPMSKTTDLVWAHHLHRGVVLGGGARGRQRGSTGETEGEHRGGGQAQCGHGEEVLLIVLTLGSHREGVEEGGDEEEQEEEDDGEEDEPLEPPPQDEAKSLIGRGEPQEGGLRTTAGEGEEN
ncbi:hypothetical protein CRUP_022953, partial [Coryphaenoides rupestris]